jgi:DNA polymerase III subunit delta
MLYIFYGQDDYSIQQALEELKKGIVDETFGVSGIVTLEGNHVTFPEFKVVCETIPFFSEKRLVVTRGLLERFEGRQKQRQTKKTSNNSQLKEWQPFAVCINNLPESTILVIIDNEINKINPLFKEISDKAQVRVYPLLKHRELVNWIQKRVIIQGSQISPQATDLMAKLVGNDLWTLSTEVDKLTLYASGRLILEKDVKAIVSHAQETSVFNLIDAIIEGNVGLAEELLQQLLNIGATPVYLLSMLSRQIRLDVLAKEMVINKKSDTEMKLKLGLADYPFKKTIEQAGKYSLDSMKRIYEKLLETDVAIKIGKYDDNLGLIILLAELSKS